MKQLLMPAFFLFLLSCNNQPGETSGGSADGNTGTVQMPSQAAFDTTIEGKKISLYFLSNGKDMQAAITNYGARMVSLWVPDKEGKPTDVILGYNNIGDYLHNQENFFGAIVGRFGNRIAKGQFSLGGKPYQLDLNNGPNSLHGGKEGLFKQVWDATQSDSSTLVLTYVSPDGEGGYPGTLTTKVTYRLTDDGAMEYSLEITTDKTTIANVTNHNYWNLNGEGSGTINDHQLMIRASKYTPVDSTLIPTGVEPVAGTPFDFTSFHKIGERVNEENTQLVYGKGYDHNFVLDKGMTSTPEPAATLKGDKSGIVMEVLTTEPGLQFYGGNFMQSAVTLKNGRKDDFRTALCLETQHFPDSPNQPSFPTTVVKPGEVYKSVSVFRFSAVKE